VLRSVAVEALEGSVRLRYGRPMSGHESGGWWWLLAAGACLGAGCFDRPPRPSEPPSAPPPAAGTAPTSAAPAPPVTPSANAPPAPDVAAELPKDFPAELPGDAWLAQHRLRPHVRCSPACGPLPLAQLAPAPVALWSQDLETVPQRFERDSRVDVYGIVLTGSAALHDHAYGTDYALEPYQAFHAPGAGVSLTALRPLPRLVLAVVSDRAPLRQIAAEPAKAWALRPGTLRIVDLQEARDWSWEQGQAHARIAFDDGRASFGLLAMSRTAPMPEHAHERAWEVIGLLAADGQLRVEPERGEPTAWTRPTPELRRLVDGDVATVPPRARHQFVSSGDQVLFAIQLYVPPGPEQRFKALASGR
jgi:hypothetical protein